jgi:hypothetical protein
LVAHHRKERTMRFDELAALARALHRDADGRPSDVEQRRQDRDAGLHVDDTRRTAIDRAA